MTINVLVTGGAGYIGSHTCKELARRGFLPVAFDNLKRGHRGCVKWGPLIVGDLANKADIRAAIETFRIDAVIHFAAYAYVGESVQHPGLYFQNNVAGTLNLLDAVTEMQIRNLIFSSSCAVYGIPERLPIVEDAPLAPINPYGESKLQIEKILPWFERAHGLKWIALRYFNAAGADADGEIGEDHEPETHLIPLAIRALFPGAPPLKIFGTDYPTPDGTAIRDFTHVADLADAHVRALTHLRDGGAPGVFNLGTGKGFSVREIVAEIENVSGRTLRFADAARRPGDPPLLVANPTRARNVLGWQPRHSDLATIVRSALGWELKKCGARAAE